MSYSIYYNKQFIKVNEKFLPMILGGDNNVYEITNRGQKRARSWSNNKWITNGNFLATKEEMLAQIEKVRQDSIKSGEASAKQWNDESYIYSDKNFGWHNGISLYVKGTSSTTFQNFKGFFIGGMRNAMTIEELAAKGVHLNIQVYYWKEEDITSTGLEIKPQKTILTTQHLLDTIKEWREYYGDKFMVYFNFNNKYALERMFKDKALDKRISRNNKPKEKKEVTEYWVIHCKNTGGYFKKFTRRGYHYVYTSNGGKMFTSEKSATKFHEKMKSKEIFEVEKISEKTFIYA